MEVQWEDLLFAFSLTLFAGLATGIGSALAFFTKTTNTKMLSIALGFSAGVMIYVSFMEILPKAQDIFLEHWMSKQNAAWSTAIFFFIGIFLIALIDKLVPNAENPHEIRRSEEVKDIEKVSESNKLYRMGCLTALAIAIHNFPEGLATFASALKDPVTGFSVAIAIALHNIPEGIAVSVPIFYATKSRKKAFAYSFLSGLSEPVGAIAGYLLLYNFMNDFVLGAIFSSVAGIMVFISLDELLPAAEEYGEHHLSIYGLIAGMGVMAVSLLLFA